MGKYKTREEELLDNAKPIGISTIASGSFTAGVGHLAGKTAKKRLRELAEDDVKRAYYEDVLENSKHTKRGGIGGVALGAGVLGIHAYKHYKDKKDKK